MARLEKLVSGVLYTRHGPPAEPALPYEYLHSYRDGETGQMLLLTEQEAHERDPRWPAPAERTPDRHGPEDG